jgi:hypothetical protein
MHPSRTSQLSRNRLPSTQVEVPTLIGRSANPSVALFDLSSSTQLTRIDKTIQIIFR